MKTSPLEKENFGSPLIGVSANIERIRELIRHVADTALNVVICGESGVGKEVVAQNLYKASPRFGKPFLKINCAALPEGLLESELFGHEQGAFTGADRKKRGKFELAHSGVLMLDEIGDMSMQLQAKMLHVLQSGEFSPLGSEKDVRSDAWIIAATNQELEDAVQKGKFREDLYYRLNIIRIQISPLRERPEDIPPLIDYYVDKFSQLFARMENTKPSPEILRKLMAYPWPGNVRELQNVLKRTMVVGSWEETVEELSRNSRKHTGLLLSNRANAADISFIEELCGIQLGEGEDLQNASLQLKDIKKRAGDIVEKEVISHVLQQTGWNRSKATKILNVSYKTLLYKISELGLEPPPAHDRGAQG